MQFVLIACFFFSTFSKSLDHANEELRRTNKVLLQALRELAVGEDSATSAGARTEKMVASMEGDLEYACQMYYMTEDCTGPVVYMASKKYDGCQPYLFEEDALGYYFDMMVGGHCSDNTCTDCKVAAEPITKDLLVGGKTPTCRSRKYLGLSDEACPTWNFAFGPCPNMCAQFYALHAGCEPSYDGDLSCEPTQQEIDYAPQCFSHVLSDD